MGLYDLLFARAAAKGGGGGGGFTPTQAQLDAMNSGITEEGLETIENNITSLQDGTYFEEYIHGNLINIATDSINGQYYYNDNGTRATGTNANLNCFIIKVDKNTNYACDEARFLLHMSSKNDVISQGTYVTSFNSGNDEYIAVSYNKNNYPNFKISKGDTPEEGNISYKPPWLYYPITPVKNGDWSAKVSTFASDYTLSQRVDAQRDYVLECSCDCATFSGIELYKGIPNNTYYSKITIDATEYHIYNGGELTTEAAHGLTIADYITVVIEYLDTGKATVNICTSTGMATITNVDWYGYGGVAGMKALGTYTNGVIKFKSLDYGKKIAIFGDSYTNTRNNARWLYYAKNMGFDNYLISAYPGSGSITEIQSFRNVMQKCKADTVLWAVGMNDGSDTTTYPTAWKSAIDEVIEYCQKNGIELILVTVPCVPSVDHTKKNAYVKSTGLRYIDFAKAVGAETTGSTWYTGLLSTDNVHPSETGAKVLSQQALIDMPELSDLG